MIEVYLDESGVHDGAPAVTVSAVWARPSVWRRWTRAWDMKKGPIGIYHASECHGLKGAFEGWTREQRNDYVANLLPLIPKYRISGRFGGIDLNAFRETLAHRPEIIEWFGSPYLACLQWALKSVCRKASSQNQTKIAFIHEENDYEVGARRIFEYTCRKFPMLDMTLQFGSKADYVPLQCADIVAYEGYKYLNNVNATRWAFQQLDPTGKRMMKMEYDRYSTENLALSLCLAYAELKDENSNNI